MAVIGRVNGPMLKENLLRQGVDLAFETNLVYLDVNNKRLGVNTLTPNADLDINGLAIFNNSLKINGSNLIALGTNANINLTPNGSGQIVTTSNMSLANISLSGNANVNNLNSSNYVNASVLQSNIATGTAPIIAVSTTRIANLNVAVAGNLVNGTSNVIVNLSGNVNVSVGGTSDVLTVTSTGANVSGTSNVSGDASFGSNILTTASTVNIANATTTTLNIGGAATSINLGVSTGQTTLLGNLSVSNNFVTTVSANLANLRVSDKTLSVITSNGNLILQPNGTGITTISSNTAIALPSGTTGDRPGTGVPGMIRYETGSNQLEYYNGSGWVALVNSYTTISTDQFNGDGSTKTFTLSQSTTTAGVIVSINGALQQPSSAYTVSGTGLTFTEAPAASDVIEARTISSTTSITELSDGTTNITADNTNARIRTVVQNANTLDFTPLGIVLQNTSIVANASPQSVNGSAVKIDSWDPTVYSGAKYLVQINNGTSRQLTELLVTANSTAAYIANVGSVNSGSALMTFTANISSSNAALWGTGTGSGNTVKVTRQLIV